MSTCNRCGQEIGWRKEGDKNVPTNADGSRHMCMKKEGAAPVSSLERYPAVIHGYNNLSLTFEMITTDARKTGKRTLGMTQSGFNFLENHHVKDRLPLECELANDKAGGVSGIWIPGINAPDGTLRPASDIHLQNNLDQARKEGVPAKAPEPEKVSTPVGVTKPETPKETPPCTNATPPATPATGPSSGGSSPITDKEQCTSSPVVRVWSESPRISIGITVNLENFENLKLEIEGAESDADQLITRLDEILDKFGNNSPLTRELIKAYRRRVLP